MREGALNSTLPRATTHIKKRACCVAESQRSTHKPKPRMWRIPLREQEQQAARKKDEQDEEEADDERCDKEKRRQVLIRIERREDDIRENDEK